MSDDARGSPRPRPLPRAASHKRNARLSDRTLGSSRPNRKSSPRSESVLVSTEGRHCVTKTPPSAAGSEISALKAGRTARRAPVIWALRASLSSSAPLTGRRTARGEARGEVGPPRLGTEVWSEALIRANKPNPRSSASEVTSEAGRQP